MNTARVISANLKTSFKDCYNDYLKPIPEDDEELLSLAEELIKDKKQNGD